MELEPGIEGLIHVSEMSWTKKNVHPGKIVSTSQEVEVQVLEVDPVKRRISLGLKQTMRNPWEVFVEKYPPGTNVEGEVKNKTEFGLFLGLDGDVDGMVHLSDLDWKRPGEQVIEEYKKGDKVKAQVLDVDVEKERISLGIKQLEGDPIAEPGDLKSGAVVTTEVTEVKEGGIDVKIVGTEFPPSSSATTSRATAPSSAPNASRSARRSMPASRRSTTSPARSACRSRRWKSPRRRKRSSSTARPIRARRSATFSALRSSSARRRTGGGSGLLARPSSSRGLAAVSGDLIRHNCDAKLIRGIDSTG